MWVQGRSALRSVDLDSLAFLTGLHVVGNGLAHLGPVERSLDGLERPIDSGMSSDDGIVMEVQHLASEFHGVGNVDLVVVEDEASVVASPASHGLLDRGLCEDVAFGLGYEVSGQTWIEGRFVRDDGAEYEVVGDGNYPGVVPPLGGVVRPS